MKRWVAIPTILLAFTIAAPPSTAGSRFRIVVKTPGGRRVDCNGGRVSGVGNVVVKGYASGPSRSQSFRFDYEPNGVTDAWYPVMTPRLPDREVKVLDLVQDLSPAPDGALHTLQWIGDGVQSCTFRAFNVPRRSEGTKSPRKVSSDPLDDMHIRLFRYGGDGARVRCGSRMAAGRIRVVVMAKDRRRGSTNMHQIHIHQESRPSFARGPDQDGDGFTHRWWEFGFRRVRVRSDGRWHRIGGHVVTQAPPGRNTFHAAEGDRGTRGAIERFCSFRNTAS